MEKMKAQKELLECVRYVSDFEKIVALLAGRKGVIKSMSLIGYGMELEQLELIDRMEVTVNWINDRLESGYYSGNNEVLDSLREHKTYLINSIKELKR